MTDPIRDRYDTVHRTLQAIRSVPGLLGGVFDLEHEPQEDHPSWVIQFNRTPILLDFQRFVFVQERDGMVTIQIIHRPGKHADGIRVAQWVEVNPPLHVLASAVTGMVTGRTIIPPESRKVVRDVLANAVNDARFHYRIGLDYILSTLDVSERWAVLDDADKWSFIVENYAIASRTKSKHVGYMNSWRALGIPMAVMDIYDDAYTEEAMNLINGITGEKSNG